LKATPMNWDRVQRFKGIVQMYRDLIALRRNVARTTGGLCGPSVNVFHADSQDKALAYHRFGSGGPQDDAVVVVTLASHRRAALTLGFPGEGRWVVRFNSGAAVYDADFRDGDSFDVTARPGSRDGLNFNADVAIGPYSVVIPSQD